MAAIRCAGAGRALLRRSPGLLRRAAGVGEPGLLQQHPIGALLSLSSNRYISSSSYFDDRLQGPEKKKLAAALMKEGSDDKEIENMDEMLRHINSTKDSYAFTDKYVSFDDAAKSDSCRQQAAARTALEAQKLELVSDLLRPAGAGIDCRKKMEEFAVAVRSHRQSLVIEDLIRKCEGLEVLNAKMVAAMVIWGIPITIAVLAQMPSLGP